ncbi:hypothetical protein, partial [Cetobacterium sp.]|uniref:hypothetical protein n=1 Tax=Cetobacterium sp. TaxID=2071632 RepID=UPI003F37546C
MVSKLNNNLNQIANEIKIIETKKNSFKNSKLYKCLEVRKLLEELYFYQEKSLLKYELKIINLTEKLLVDKKFLEEYKELDLNEFNKKHLEEYKKLNLNRINKILQENYESEEILSKILEDNVNKEINQINKISQELETNIVNFLRFEIILLLLPILSIALFVFNKKIVINKFLEKLDLFNLSSIILICLINFIALIIQKKWR